MRPHTRIRLLQFNLVALFMVVAFLAIAQIIRQRERQFAKQLASALQKKQEEEEAIRHAQEAEEREKAKRKAQQTEETIQRTEEKLQQSSDTRRQWWGFGILLLLFVLGYLAYWIWNLWENRTIPTSPKPPSQVHPQTEPIAIQASEQKFTTSEECSEAAKRLSDPGTTGEEVGRWIRECGQFRWLRR